MASHLLPDLTSVVVVTADSGPLVRECVRRVLGCEGSLEVVLVDNASIDGEIDAVLSGHSGDSRLRVLRNTENVGFGPACNRGAAIARGDALLFLNPDCLLESDTITRLREVAARHAGVGVIGVRVEDAKGHPERAMRRRDPTLRRVLMTLTGLARFESRHPALAGISMATSPARIDAEPVDAVSGACLFLPRAAFDAVGGFDESYFLHGEDLDLCRRVRDSGYRVLFADAIHVRHEQGSSSRRRPAFVARHKHRSMWRYFTKFDRAARSVPLRALVWLGIWAHYYVQAPLRRYRG